MQSQSQSQSYKDYSYNSQTVGGDGKITEYRYFEKSYPLQGRRVTVNYMIRPDGSISGEGDIFDNDKHVNFVIASKNDLDKFMVRLRRANHRASKLLKE